MYLLALSLPFCSEAATGPSTCDKERAAEAFLSGMRHYDQHCSEVIPRLEEAAQFCPAPERAWPIRPNPFLEYSYLPYYFLGKCHYHLKDLPNALRQFYLSSCVGEPQRDKDGTHDLDTLTGGCRRQLESKQPPQRHPYFSEGFSAAQQQDWKEAAEKMWDALQVWEEDGTTTVSSGRWTAPYLPRFRLADALLQLGCYQEACAQLDQSKLKQLPKEKKELELERRRMKELESLCEKKKRERPEEKAMCQQWRCWLQQGGH